MPSTTSKQAHLMAAVAHGWHKPGGGGPSVNVATEFNNADKGSGIMSKFNSKPQNALYAAGGPVLGRTREFLKETDEFREDETGGKDDADQDYTKGKGNSTPKNTPKVLKK